MDSTEASNGGGGGGTDGRDDSRLVNARASKLVRAEAEAYADVEVSLYNPGKKIVGELEHSPERS